MKFIYFSLTPSAKYISRTNAGSIVFRYNDDETERNWKCENGFTAKIKNMVENSIYYYMHNSLTDYLDYWNDNIEKIGKLIIGKYSLEEEMPMNHRGVVRTMIN